MIDSILPKGLLRIAVGLLLLANALTAAAATRVEYFLNSDPGPGRAVFVSPGTGGSGYQSVDIDTSGVPYGINYVGLRAWVDGHWSSTTTCLFFNPMPEQKNSYFLEYFWDKDPGPGNATAVSLPVEPEGQTLPIEISAAGLTPGRHTLGVRVHSLSGWSQTMIADVCVSDDHTYEIIAAEYFWGDDPGLGKGTPIALTPGKEIDLDKLEIEFPAEEAPEYVLSFRARTVKSWGHTTTTVITHQYVTAISIDPSAEELVKDDRMHLHAEVLPEEAFNSAVKWDSSDESVATVDDDGNVTGIAPGEATITATSTDGTNISGSCHVTVKTLSGTGFYADTASDVKVIGGDIHILACQADEIVTVANVAGIAVYSGTDHIVRGLSSGIYFVIVADKVFKIHI